MNICTPRTEISTKLSGGTCSVKLGISPQPLWQSLPDAYHLKAFVELYLVLEKREGWLRTDGDMGYATSWDSRRREEVTNGQRLKQSAQNGRCTRSRRARAQGCEKLG
ncbi:hypothetical protein PISMIDRAFT_684308 [Pisolithus microcarpus 441]|uniref:Uncharacterized protein n=1 Tax=Pisolithus microcarpus 441 TaxID=765257 RepID=A0A0C9YNF5_9AGAM|nr:hypothetical protein PISMIDRAFT_684308 [Pisolithus microcarpus 441]